MKKTIIIFILLSLIPIGIIGGGLYWAVNKKAIFEKYKPTKGIIVSLNEEKLFDNIYKDRNLSYPTIQYHDDKGESYTFELKTGSESYKEMLGQEVDLLYNPKNPEDVMVDSFMSKWLGPVVVCTVGLLILIILSIISCAVILKDLKDKTKQ